MAFVFDYRSSDSPFVEMIWRTQTEAGGSFMSSAGTTWEMVITKQRDKMTLTVRGPETKASPAPIPEDAEYLGIAFKLGTFMPHLPTIELVNKEIHLPQAGGDHTFWFNGSAWQFPNFENADTFIARLMRNGMLVRDPVIDSLLQGKRLDLSLRTAQRRFLRATGMTQGTLHQIERARKAMALLQQGASILDTVDLAGYADQPHLTRSLKQLMGHTPAQILRVTDL